MVGSVAFPDLPARLPPGNSYPDPTPPPPPPRTRAYAHIPPFMQERAFIGSVVARATARLPLYPTACFATPPQHRLPH